MQPGNPVVGGTVLRRPAIQSPNFVTTVSGWTINADGSAEFNNLTIRGTFSGTDYVLSAAGFFLYSGTPASGNLIFSIAPAATTGDGLGNTVTGGGAVSYTPGTTQFANLAAGFLQLRPPGAGAGALGAFVDSTAPGQATFDSGETAGGDTDAALLLLSANSNGGVSQIVLEAQAVQLLASTGAVIPLTAPAATSAAIIAALKSVGIFK